MSKIYTTKYINIISLVLTIIVFLIINLICFFIKNPSIFQFGFHNTMKVEFNDNTNLNISDNKDMFNLNNSSNEEKIVDLDNTLGENDVKQNGWYLIIPRIFLEAEISEGTTTEVMNKYVGHFTESSKTDGNICLAAHNRGYPVNYFQNLKLLKKDDVIKYKYKEYEKKYSVTNNYIIRDTDWNCLEDTEENSITLITCIENEPDFRRCIRGVEIKDN